MYKAFISGGGESSQHFKRCIDMNLRTRGMNYSIVLVSVIVYLTCVEEMCSRFRQSELCVVLCVCCVVCMFPVCTKASMGIYLYIIPMCSLILTVFDK